MGERKGRDKPRNRNRRLTGKTMGRTDWGWENGSGESNREKGGTTVTK